MKALRMPDPRREGKGVGACVAPCLCSSARHTAWSEPLCAPPCGLCSVQQPSVHTVHSIARTPSMVSARDVTLKATNAGGGRRGEACRLVLGLLCFSGVQTSCWSEIPLTFSSPNLNQASDWTHLSGCFLPNDTDYIGIRLGLESSSATNLGIS